MNKTIFILALTGFVLSYYIWFKKSKKEKLRCVIGKDCNKVINSKYSETFGIDNTILGMLYYIFLILVGVVLFIYPGIFGVGFFSQGFLIVTGIVALFSLYLTVVQLFILKEICEYCLANSLIVIAIFVINLKTF